MTRDDIAARIRTDISEMFCLDPHEVRLDTHFSDLTDDFGRMEIIMAAEEFADLEIGDEEAESFKTVGDLIAFLAGKLGVAEVAA